MGALGAYADTPLDNVGSAPLMKIFTGHAVLIHDFIRRLPKRAVGGRILVFSGAGLGASARYVDHISAYSTAKAAASCILVEALCAGAQKSQRRITINAIAPGAVFSGMTRQTLAAGANAGSLLKDAQACARSRRGRRLELAADLVQQLLAPRAATITGRLLSARFDRSILLKKTATIAGDDHYFRLRRIDHALFKPGNRA